MRQRIANLKGLSVGMSAAAAVWASVEVGRDAPGAVVVTILPDAGHVRTEGDP
jgi:cysteine synthase